MIVPFNLNEVKLPRDALELSDNHWPYSNVMQFILQILGDHIVFTQSLSFGCSSKTRKDYFIIVGHMACLKA